MKGFKTIAITAAMTLAISCSLSGLAADSEQTKATPKATPNSAIEPEDSGKRSITVDELNFGSFGGGRDKNVTRTIKDIKKEVVKKTPKKAAPVAASKTTKPATAKTIAKTKTAPATPLTAVKPAQPQPTQKPGRDLIEETAQGTDNESSPVIPVSASKTSRMVVSAWLDKQGTTPRYKSGEKMVVNVTTSMDCNLVVFNYDAKGTLTQLFPNSDQPSGFVRAGDSVQIGGPDSPFDFEVGGKGGLERIFVYAYPTNTSEAPITVAMNKTENSPFRSTEMSLAKYRELVNGSRAFFSREVKVVPKNRKPGGAALTASSTVTEKSETEEPAPNKVELTFMVEP